MCEQVVLSRKSVHFNISKRTLQFPYFFLVPCIIFWNVNFNTVFSMFFFLLNESQSGADVVNQIFHPCFSLRSIIGQLNLRATTSENEK